MPLSCCVTGHRIVPENKKSHIRVMLVNEIVGAIEAGCGKFYSGMAEGIDLLFVEILAELQKSNPNISIEGVVPYRGRLNAKGEEFRRLAEFCDIIHVISETRHAGAYHERNRFMVDNSQMVIAVYDGRETGGTFYTMNYAKSLHRELRVIPFY